MEPILFYIDENQDIDISEEYGTVYKMKPIEGISRLSAVLMGQILVVYSFSR